MKKVKAFGIAFLLFAVSAVGLHFLVEDRLDVRNTQFSMWGSEAKSKAREELCANMNKGTIPVFGSSEFLHGTETPYHPREVFRNTEFNPMLIGAGYYQSLSHAITLGAVSDSMQQKKAVIVVSPQWFRKSGVVDQAFATRFSETNYIGMLQNEKISEETKAYIKTRTDKLLDADIDTKKRVKIYETVYDEKSGSEMQNLYADAWKTFLTEKDRFTVYGGTLVDRISYNQDLVFKDQVVDWKRYLRRAEREGLTDKQNQFYMVNSSYEKLRPHLDKKKGISKDAVNGYGDSPEYDDLKCFLKVCRDLQIQPMIVILPVNGFYYDFTEFPKAAREKYYENIRELAGEFGAATADFSGDEYTKYFFEDRVHIGRKGWVEVNESLYNFYKED